MRIYKIVIGSSSYFDKALDEAYSIIDEKNVKIPSFLELIRIFDAQKQSGNTDTVETPLLFIRNNDYNGIVNAAHDRLGPLIEDITHDEALILIHNPPRVLYEYLQDKKARNLITLEEDREEYSIQKEPEKFKENIWFVYYKAKILQLLGRPKESESYIASILFSKSGEYWVWHCYAELLEELSDSRSFSFLCKAASLIREEDKARNVRGDLVKALVARGYFGEAKREIAIIDETTERFGFKKLSDIEEVKHHSRWFKDTVAATSNKEFYVEQVLIHHVHQEVHVLV